MRHKILIIKLAALGDVASAARCLADVFGTIPEKAEFHWLLDSRYKPLATSMLETLGIRGVTFHEIDTEQLFQGSTPRKMLVTAGLLKKCIQVRPTAIVLLHRDTRYRLALRTVFRGSIYGLATTIGSEATLYLSAFQRMRNDLFKNHPSSESIQQYPLIEDNQIGILIGGGANTKGVFFEKRWPHTKALVERLMSLNKFKVTLFGGPSDEPDALEICAGLSIKINEGRLTNLVGKVALEELPIALRKMNYFVCVDSGLGHIASAVMTAKQQRVISLFGPTDPRIWAPLSRGNGSNKVLYKALSCSPCYKNDGFFHPCPYRGDEYQKCMREIGVDEVIRQITS